MILLCLFQTLLNFAIVLKMLFPLLYASTCVKKWLTFNASFKSHIISTGPASSAGEALPVQG